MTIPSKLKPAEIDFPTFTITNQQNDKEPGFQNAILVTEAPGRAICTSVPKFREAKNIMDKSNICEKMPAIRRGFGLGDLILVGIITASLTYSVVKVVEWQQGKSL